MYYSSDEQDTPDMTGKAFKSHLKGAKNWTDEEISLLMDMLEEKLCLWDVFDKEYMKRDVKEIACTEITSSLEQTPHPSKQKLMGSEVSLEGK